MNCEQAQEYFPEYWDSTLQDVERRELAAHLSACPGCRDECTRLKSFWYRLGAIPEELPDAAGKARFEALLSEYRKIERRSKIDLFFESWWPKKPLAQVAFSTAALLIGLLAGHALTVDRQRSREVARLQEEVASTRQLVVLSLLRQRSATDRLKGVDWSSQVTRPEPQIVKALLETVNYDDTVDVRLAAVDALRRFSQEPQVRSALDEALARQDSPLVQIALIDALADNPTPVAIAAIERLSSLNSTNPAVRSHAHSALEMIR